MVLNGSRTRSCPKPNPKDQHTSQRPSARNSQNKDNRPGQLKGPSTKPPAAAAKKSKNLPQTAPKRAHFRGPPPGRPTWEALGFSRPTLRTLGLGLVFGLAIRSSKASGIESPILVTRSWDWWHLGVVGKCIRGVLHGTGRLWGLNVASRL